MGHAHTMLQTLPRRWSALSPDARRHLLNAAVFGITLDGGIATVLLNLYVLRLGFGPEFVGLMNAIGMFVFALSSFPGGRLGERFGLRRVMLTGIALCLVGSALGPASEALPDMLRPFVIIAGAALGRYPMLTCPEISSQRLPVIAGLRIAVLTPGPQPRARPR